MPELPEVEIIRTGLSKLLPGQKISSVKSNWPKSFPNAKADVDKFLIGAKILGVRRRAKVLIVDLDTDYSLLIHLKMTGQLVFVAQTQEARNSKPETRNKSEIQRNEISNSLGFRNSDFGFAKSDELRFGAGHPTNSLVGKLPDKSTRVIFDLSDAKLFFNDQRKFGWVRLVPTLEIGNIDFFKKLGPEPLKADFSPEKFAERIRKRPNSMIKPVLMDQSVIAGVGNIYADEALWGAKIHPQTRVNKLDDMQLKKLFKELRYVLKLSIQKGGSTDKNYIDAEGKKGSYLSFARVFRRQNLPCPRCGSTIVKTTVMGRGTHTCPTCQIQV